ncbi:amino acid adenylation domain-containing protein [Arthrobacter sp. UM1]|nr:amino acid adenylation domain-containing protein [Arthrobacter sp. UM1]
MALVAESGQWTYGQLLRWAGAFAEQLQGEGVGQGTVVALHCNRGPGLVAALVALAQLGSIVLPLDRGHPARRSRSAIEDSGCGLLIEDGGFDDLEYGPDEWPERVPLADGTGAACQKLSLRKAPRAPGRLLARDRETAYVLYTSGTTGRPKGVRLGSQGIVDLLSHDSRVAVGSEDRVAMLASPAFDAMLLEVWLALTNGASLVVGASQDVMSVSSLGDFLWRNRVSVLWLTAGLFHEIVRADVEVFRGLRRLMTGGDVVSTRHFARVRQKFPAIELFNCYGPTENTIFSTVYEGNPEGEDLGSPLPIGTPVGATRTRIVDSEYQEVAPGFLGELWVGGARLSPGYLNSDHHNSTRFTFDENGERWFKTGDFVRLRADGELEFCGREDDQVKIRGHRASLGEIQNAVLQAPGIRDCCAVLSHEDPPRLIAYVVESGESTPAGGLLPPGVQIELRETVGNSLPDSMVPQLFIAVRDFPLTPNGKTDRRALPFPESAEAFGLEQNRIESGSELEQEVLRLSSQAVRAQTGLRTNLLTSGGGDSLSLMRLIAAVERQYGVCLAAETVFSDPTPAGIAAAVSEAKERGGTFVSNSGKGGPQRQAPDFASSSSEQTTGQGAIQYRAAPAQQQFWRAHCAAPASVQYNCPQAFRLRGGIQTECLIDSVDALVDETGLLRSTFSEDVDGVLWVHEHPRVRRILDVVDLTGQVPEEREAQLNALLEAYCAQPFALESGPVLRGALISLAEDEFVLFLDVHHIVTDGWSQGLLNRRLNELYSDKCAGRASAAPPGESYSEAARRRGEDSHLARLENQRQWWGERLCEVEPLRLPTDRPRPLTRSRAGDRVTSKIAPELLERCQLFASEEHASVFSVLVAALRILLAQHSGQMNPTLGVVVSGRTDSREDETVGPFVNTLPITGSLDPDENFSGVVANSRDSMMEAFAAGDLAVGDILAAWNELGPGESYAEISVSAVLQDEQDSSLMLDGAEVEAVCLPRHAAIFDLAFEFTKTQNSMDVSLEYDAEIFDRETVRALLERFGSLLEMSVGNARGGSKTLAIRNLPIVSPHEEQRILQGWNGRHEAFDESPVHLQFLHQVQADPQKLALRELGCSVSYGRLEQLAHAGANRLREAGVVPGDIVPVALPPGVDFVVALLALGFCGAAPTPLAPETPRARFDYVVRDTRAQVVVANASTTVPVGPRVVDMSRLLADQGERAVFQADQDHPAYVIYTSGTTGRPKGVVVAHRQLAGLCHWARRELGLRPGKRMAQLVSLGFDPVMLEVWGTLASGATLTVPENRVLGDPPELVRWLAEEEVTHAIVVTSRVDSVFDEISLLLERADREGTPSGLALDALIVGGERLRRRPEQSWRFRVYNAYGPTEATVLATVGLVAPESPRMPESPSIGQAIPNMDALIVDDEGRLLPPGIPGELWLRGVGLAVGYLGQEGLTTERFFNSECFGRVYRTGDTVRWTRTGEIQFIGRNDSQVKIRGHRIELGEVEQVLAESGAPSGTRVLARQDARGHTRLVAYALCSSEGPDMVAREALSASVLAAASRMLPGYMQPEFLWIDKWPMTSRGKLDEGALPLPAWGEGRTSVENAEPLSVGEQALAEAWEEVLGLPPASRNESFFAAGGDSILALQLVSAARRRGFTFNAQAVFREQTVQGLAAGQTASLESGIIQTEPWGELPLLPVHRLYFEGVPGGAAFNQSVVLGLRTEVEDAEIIDAVRRVVKAHPGLGLQVQTGPGGPIETLQAVEPNVEVRTLPRTQSLHEVISEIQSEPLPAREPSLFRAVVLSAGGERKLVLVAHHLVIDGVSWRIILSDLEQAWADLRTGGNGILPEGTGLRAWATALNSQRARFEGDREKWAEHMRGLLSPPPGLEPGRESEAVTVTARFSQAETSRLEELLRLAHRGSMKDVLLGVASVAVMDWLGDDEITVGIEGHGRDEDLFQGCDLSRTVGWFTSYHPFRVIRPAAASGRAYSSTDLLGSIEEIRRQAERIPNPVGFGLLEAGAEIGKSGGRPAISFNYLGRFTETESAVAESVSGIVLATSPDAPRLHGLDLLFHVSGGRLEFTAVCGGRSAQSPRLAELADVIGTRIRQLLSALGDEEETGPFPLTEMQKGLLVHSLGRGGVQRAGGGPHEGKRAAAYLEQISFDIHGTDDPERLAEAWKETARSRPVMRTTLHLDGADGGVQRVHEDSEGVTVSVCDWRDFSESDIREKTAEYVRQDAARGLRLDRLPVMRVMVAQTGASTARVIWTFPHALLDGWSGAQLIAEVLLRFAGDRERAARPRPSFRSYVDWVRSQSQDGLLGDWKRYLEGIEGSTPLPFSRPGADDGEVVADSSIRFNLTTSETELLERFARRERVTVNTVLQGAWGLVLSRLTQEDTVTFGATVAGRPSEVAGAEDILGMFINTLPVRVDYERGRSPGAFLRHLQEEASALRAVENVSQSALRSLVGLKPGESLFSSVIVYENYPSIAAEYAPYGLSISGMQGYSGTNFPLNIVAYPGDEFSLLLTFDDRRISECGVRSLARLLRIALLGLTRAKTLGSIRLTTGSEQAELVALGDGGESTDRFELLWEPLARNAEENPEAVALVDTDGQSWSYKALWEKVLQCARGLIARRFSPGDRALILMPRGAEAVVALFAVLRAGGVVIPLEVGTPIARVRSMAETVGAQWVLVDAEAGAAHSDPVLDGVETVSDLSRAPAHEETLPERNSPSAPAYMVFTSGTTGKPKGVVVSHSGARVTTSAAARLYGVGSGTRVLLVCSLAFDGGLQDLFGVLGAGGTLVLAGNNALAGSSSLHEQLRRFQIDFVSLPTSLAAELSGEFPSLKAVGSGGEALTGEIASRPRTWDLVNLYGPSEATILATTKRIGAWPSGKGVPIGRPVSGVRCRVLGADLALLPRGGTGELYIAGAGVALGYAGAPAQTAERFVADPYGPPGSRMYRTGDLVRWLPDGDLEFVGRVDQQVKVRGFRVEMGEVESALRALSGIEDALVVPSETGGVRELAAYCIAAPGAPAPTPGELREQLAESLPEYLVPAAFVMLGEFPLNSNRKVDRSALPPVERRHRVASAFRSPSNPTEEAVLTAWKDVLGISDMGVDDDVFALGADSLSTLRLLPRLTQAFGVEIAPRDVFQNPTVAKLADTVLDLILQQLEAASDE